MEHETLLNRSVTSIYSNQLLLPLLSKTSAFSFALSPKTCFSSSLDDLHQHKNIQLTTAKVSCRNAKGTTKLVINGTKVMGTVNHWQCPHKEGYTEYNSPPWDRYLHRLDYFRLTAGRRRWSHGGHAFFIRSRKSYVFNTFRWWLLGCWSLLTLSSTILYIMTLRCGSCHRLAASEETIKGDSLIGKIILIIFLV